MVVPPARRGESNPRPQGRGTPRRRGSIPRRRAPTSRSPPDVPRCRSASATAKSTRRRQQDRPSRRAGASPTSATSTRCGSRPAPSPACTTAPPPPASSAFDPHRRRADRRGAGVPPAGRPAACRGTSARRFAAKGIHAFSQSIAMGHSQGLISRRRPRASWPPTRASWTTPSTTRPTCRFEYFGLRTVYDRYLLRHPHTRAVNEHPQVFLLRVACGLSRTPVEAIRLYGLCPRWPTCRARRRCSTPARPTRRCRRAPGGLAEGRARQHLRPLRAGREAVEVRRRDRDPVVAGAFPRCADSRDQRPVERDRAVAADPRLLGRRGQPGWPAQGRRMRVPRDLAPRHRGVPRAAGQHRRGRAARPQPQPRELGARRVHAQGSSPTACGR